MTQKFCQLARSGTKRDLLIIIGSGVALIVATGFVASRPVIPAPAAA